MNTALIAAFQKYGIDPRMWRMLLGFAVAEGDNPSGNPTLGFVDYQLPSIGTDLDSHVDALADQLGYRLPVSGPFPASGSDWDQAQWMAVVVGQAGSSSDWQGNVQPSQDSYINSIVTNMPPQSEIDAVEGESTVTEIVLAYDHSITPQEQSWDCGPASTQVVLSGRGIVDSESDLITREGTNLDGTADISQVSNALNQSLPDAGYVVAYMRDDPPTQDQKDALWSAITRSIDAGYGLVANIVAPPSNYPRGVKGSQSPSYGGGTVFHYVPLMGYDPDERAVWVADPGFQPFGYWVSFDQLATLIPPKGYCYATAAVPVPPEVDPVTQPDPAPSWPTSATDRELLEYIAAQLGPGDPAWPSKGSTLRDKVWSI